MDAWTVLTSVAVLLFYFATGINVAVNRTRHEVMAPAMSGHPLVERALRVQGNTLEYLVIFLPALWMFSLYFDPRIGAVLGGVWILGRVLYLTSYMADPASRGPGFAIQALATMTLLGAATTGAVMRLV